MNRVHERTGACAYDRFRHLVGEPRGVEYTAVFRVPYGILNGHVLWRFAPDYD